MARGGIGHTIKGVLLGLVLAVACIFGYRWWQSQQAASLTTTSLETLEESMQKNNELSTAKYLYTASVAVKDQNTLAALGLPDVALPFTEATYIFQFDGTIKAGYDLSQAKLEQSNDGVITVTLPAAQILSHETGDVQITYEEQNIANPLKAGEESEWIAAQKEKMAERAESEGLFTEAQENAKATFETLFASALSDDVKLEFVFE